MSGPAAQTRPPWRDGLVQQFDALGRNTRRRLIAEPAPEEELVPIERFFDREYLRGAIADTVPALRGGGAEVGRDLRVAVSRFSRRICAPLSATALVGLARGIGVDLSPAGCTIVIRSDGQFGLILDPARTEVLRCAERPAPWAAEGPSVQTLDELREYVWRQLYGTYLAPIYTLALELVPVSPRLVWSSAAEWVGLVSDLAEEYLGVDAAPFLADRHAVLGAAKLPGVRGENPLQHKLEWVPVAGDGFPAEVQTRRYCCITYLLDDRLGELCGNCPYLSAEDRATLARLRHDRPPGTPRPPEEQEIMFKGLERPGVRRRAAQRAQQS